MKGGNEEVKTYCFKLYNSKKTRNLKHKINIAGIIYNHCVALHRRYYRLFHKSLNKFELQKHLTKLKHREKFSYWNLVPSHAIQDITERVSRAYKLFFENLKRNVKTSPPRFQKVKKYKSFSYNMVGKNIIIGNKIKIAGDYYKFSKSREVKGNIKILTIKRDSLGDLYVYVVSDESSDTLEARSGKIVGFDFGLKTFLTSSDGNHIESPLFFKKSSRSIKQLSKKLSRKKSQSHHERARLDLARAHKKIYNQRRDFHYKTSLMLCREYGVMCFETLNLKGMQRLWGRKVSDLGFYSFMQILKYEAYKNGVRIIEIPKYYPSSQTCSECSYKNPEVKNLRIRSWKCPECGAVNDRDINAAKNILRVGASTLSGDTVRPEQSCSVVDARIHRL